MKTTMMITMAKIIKMMIAMMIKTMMMTTLKCANLLVIIARQPLNKNRMIMTTLTSIMAVVGRIA